MTIVDAPQGTVSLDAVPVFPLSGVVLLPEQRLPLHIFEPRYRAMVRDALESSPYIAVARIAGDPHAEPSEIARIVTVGRIVAHQRLPDGRFNILVEGRVRVELDELPFQPPYRRARGTLLPEPLGVAAEVLPVARAALLALTSQVIAQARARQLRFDFDAPLDLPSARLALRLVDRFVTDPLARQRLIDAPTAAARVAVATEALACTLLEGTALRAVGTA